MIGFLYLFLNDVRKYIKGGNKKTTHLGLALIWFGGMVLSIWDIVISDERNILFSIGTLIIAIGFTVNLVDLLRKTGQLC
jgi:hypothetical protein